MFFPQDKVRTESYRDFMYRNPEVFKDKVSIETHKHTRAYVCDNECLFCTLACRIRHKAIEHEMSRWILQERR